MFLNWDPGEDNSYGTGDDGGFLSGEPTRPLLVNIGGRIINGYIVAKNVRSARFRGLRRDNGGGRVWWV